MLRLSRRNLSKTTSSSQNINRINNYDSNVYSRDRPRTRIVVREKPFVQSRSERIWAWLKPSHSGGESLVDGLQLAKMAGLMVMPLFMILMWRRTQKDAPAALEAKSKGFQSRTYFDDGESHSDSVDYFTVIDNFEERRATALAKLQGKNAKP